MGGWQLILHSLLTSCLVHIPCFTLGEDGEAGEVSGCHTNIRNDGRCCSGLNTRPRGCNMIERAIATAQAAERF